MASVFDVAKYITSARKSKHLEIAEIVLLFSGMVDCVDRASSF